MLRQQFRSLLRVKLPTREVGLLFKHHVFEDKDGKRRPVVDFLTCKKPLNGITYCEIYRIIGEDATIQLCGRSYCKVPDSFNRRLGRKLALTSALRKVDAKGGRIFTQEERTLIWAAYWEKVIPSNGPLHPYGPVQAADLVTAEGQILGGE